MPRKHFQAEDTVYQTEHATLLLRETRYSLDKGSVATIHDDGHIDLVAVQVAASGDRKVNLTPRELVCVVAELAGQGFVDERIAARLGRPGDDGKAWILSLRRRNRIESNVGQYASADNREYGAA